MIQNMISVLFGLLCLWCVSVGGTETSNITDVGTGLFTWMDSQFQQNNNITFDEFYQAWNSCDTNMDGYLSEEEVRDKLGQLDLEPTSSAETLFGSTDMKNKTSLQDLFNDIDQSNNGYINQTEFQDYYDNLSAFFDLVSNGNWTTSETGSIIITSRRERRARSRNLFK